MSLSTQTLPQSFSPVAFGSSDYKFMDGEIEGSSSISFRGLDFLAPKQNNISTADYLLIGQTDSQNVDYTVAVFKFEEFDFEIELEIAEIKWSFDSEQIIFLLTHSDLFSVIAVLDGYWDNERNFQTKGLNLKLDHKSPKPLAEFVSSSIWAMLGLSSRINFSIPDSEFNLSVGFELSVKEISLLLQERQIAQRLLIIETVTGVDFPFPKGFISGDEIGNIAFCYQAIVGREFEWFAEPQNIPWVSNEESLGWLPETPEPKSMKFRPEIVEKTIFGKRFILGKMYGIVQDAVIDNYDEVKDNLSKLNGDIVVVHFRALGRRMKFISLNVPQFDIDNWGEQLQKLYHLESRLDDLLLNKYFAAAAATLDSFTPEQKKAVTERPKKVRTHRS